MTKVAGIIKMFISKFLFFRFFQQGIHSIQNQELSPDKAEVDEFFPIVFQQVCALMSSRAEEEEKVLLETFVSRFRDNPSTMRVLMEIRDHRHSSTFTQLAARKMILALQDEAGKALSMKFTPLSIGSSSPR